MTLEMPRSTQYRVIGKEKESEEVALRFSSSYEDAISIARGLSEKCLHVEIIMREYNPDRMGLVWVSESGVEKGDSLTPTFLSPPLVYTQISEYNPKK